MVELILLLVLLHLRAVLVDKRSDMPIDDLEVLFDDLVLMLLLMGPVLGILVEEGKGLLADGHLQKVPIIQPHEVF